MAFNVIFFAFFVGIYLSNAQTVIEPGSCSVVINKPGNPLTYIEFHRTAGQLNQGIEYYLYYTDTSGTFHSRYLTQSYSADGSSYHDYQSANSVNLDIAIDTTSDVYMRGYHYTTNTFSNNVEYCTVTARPTAAPSQDTAAPTPSPIGLNCNYGGNGWIASLPYPSAAHDWILEVPYYGYSSVIISTCMAETNIATTLKLYDSSKNNLIDSDTDGSNTKCGSNQGTSEIIFGESSGWWTQGYNYIIEISGYLGAYGQYGLNVTCNPWTPSPTPATGSIGCNTGSITGTIDSAYETSNFIFAMPYDLKSVAFSTCSSLTDVDTTLSIYNATEQIRSIASNGDPDPSVYNCTQGLGYGTRTSYLVFDQATYANDWNPGHNYRLSVQDGYGLTGTFELSISCEYHTSAPSSAPTATPQEITCDSGTVSGYMTANTRVRYLFDVPSHVNGMQFSTCNTGTTIDTHLYLYTTVSKSVLITENDDFEATYSCLELDGSVVPARASIFDFDSLTGSFIPGAKGYMLEVGGWQDTQIGDFELTVTCDFDPTSEPTPQPTQPPSEEHVSVVCGDSVSDSIDANYQVKYYVWSPPIGLKSVTFTTCDGTTMDTHMYLYEGMNPTASFQPLRENDDFGGNSLDTWSDYCITAQTASNTVYSEIVVNTTGYAIYQYNYYTIKVGGFDGTTQGTYTFRVLCEYYTDDPSGAPTKAPTTTVDPTMSPIIPATDAPSTQDVVETESVVETTEVAVGHRCESYYVKSILLFVMCQMLHSFME